MALLSHISMSLALRSPQLGTVLQVRSHQCCVQGEDHFPVLPVQPEKGDTASLKTGNTGKVGGLLQVEGPSKGPKHHLNTRS